MGSYGLEVPYQPMPLFEFRYSQNPLRTQTYRNFNSQNQQGFGRSIGGSNQQPRKKFQQPKPTFQQPKEPTIQQPKEPTIQRLLLNARATPVAADESQTLDFKRSSK